MANRSLKKMSMTSTSQMSLDETSKNIEKMFAKHNDSDAKHSTFVIEVLLLLVCLVFVILVSVSAIAASTSASTQSSRTEQAIIYATSVAERFAANPAYFELPESRSELHDMKNGFSARLDIDKTQGENGCLYEAKIIVSYRGKEACSLITSAYTPGKDISTEDKNLSQNGDGDQSNGSAMINAGTNIDADAIADTEHTQQTNNDAIDSNVVDRNAESANVSKNDDTNARQDMNAANTVKATNTERRR